MRKYEIMVLIDPDTDDRQVTPMIEKHLETITAAGGTVDNVDAWGKRKLAYEINDLTDGDYTLINFHADPTQIAELDRVLRITDAVVRHMIVRRDDQE